MKTHLHKVQIATRGEFDTIDITADVEKVVVNSGIDEGFVIVYSHHTTFGVLINERESGLLSDMCKTLARLVPSNDSYLHDDFDIRTENMHPDESKNAYAHLRHILGGRTSECVPVSESTLQLGEWQRIMAVEFDRAREREILIQVSGT